MDLVFSICVCEGTVDFAGRAGMLARIVFNRFYMDLPCIEHSIGIAWCFKGSEVSFASYDDLSCGPESASMQLSSLTMQLYVSLSSHIDMRYELRKAKWLREKLYDAKSSIT